MSQNLLFEARSPNQTYPWPCFRSDGCGLGLRVQGLGFRVWGLGFRV